MKTHLLRTSLLAVVAAVSVHAQNSSFRVNIPFDFIVGDQTLAAGEYAVDQQSFTGAVKLTCVDHKGSAVTVGLPISSAAGAQNEEKLVFHRYNKTYFLAQVWGAGAYGRKLPTTKREDEMAAQKAGSDNVTVVASR
jgi:hypothetical protein